MRIQDVVTLAVQLVELWVQRVVELAEELLKIQ